MNTNLFLEPEIAAADMKIKVDHQKRALEDKLTELGYECLLREGTDLVRGICDATPAMHGKSDRTKIVHMDQLYTQTIFGAMDKFQFPFQNLFAAAKRAAVMAADPFDTMIVPAGLQDLHNYTRAENVYYYMQGQAKGSLPPVKFGLDGGMVDPTTGLNIFVTYPRVDNGHGTAYQTMEKGNLMRERTFGQGHFFNPGPKCTEKTMFIMDYELKRLVPVSAPEPKTDDKFGQQYTDTSPYGKWHANTEPSQAPQLWAAVVAAGQVPCYVRPKIKALMSSAILAASGANTGELLMAYPQTSVNTIATSPEMMKMQLRVYLGAYLKNPANVMVIPDCHFEGITGGGRVNAENCHWSFCGISDNAGVDARSLDFTRSIAGSVSGKPTETQSNSLKREKGKPFSEKKLLMSDPETVPLILYQGAVFGDAVGNQLLEPNEGHLGCLDCPAGMHKVFGVNVFAPGGPAMPSC